jgi:transposase
MPVFGQASWGRFCGKEGLYSSHLVTWRRQREHGLTPKKRGRKATPVDPHVKKLQQENRRLTTRLQKAEALLAYQKKVSELLQIPLKPLVSDVDDC